MVSHPAEAPAAAPRRSPVRTPLVIAVLAIAAFALVRSRSLHFDLPTLLAQFRQASWPLILAAIAAIYLGYGIRALRWSILLAPVKRVSPATLLPWQLIGFTIVGLFGRLTDMARPYLIARRTETPVATQLAIYSIERAFDLGSAAILFSLALAFAPRTMPHHEAFARAGLAALAGTLLLALMAVALRFGGDLLARLAGRLLQPLSAELARAATARLHDFREGLQAIGSLAEFLAVAALSLLMWTGIAAAYFWSTHAFTACPPLATLSLSATMLLMATSMGGSLLQLPILGWFTQIALLAAALHGFFSVPLETATACGVVLQCVLNLSVVPLGLLCAQFTGTRLRTAARDTTA